MAAQSAIAQLWATKTSEAGNRLRETAYALQECLRSALSSIHAHGLRSSLAVVGVVIAVASVVCVLALMQGLSQSISQQLQGLGGGTLSLRSDTPLKDRLRGKINRLRPTDLEELRHRIDGIANITPTVFASQGFAAEARNGPHTWHGEMFGTTASYQDVQQIFPRSGRFLTDSDDASRRRVVVLGEKARRELHLAEHPAGLFIQIGAGWFKVVGVMEPRGEMFGVSQDNYLLMPYQTALTTGGVIAEPDLSISFTVNDMDAIDDMRHRVGALMRRLHQLRPGQGDDFVVESSDAFGRTFREISTTITLVVAGVVGISLLVGGIGIMNIMLVSVTERTREIGIAKALGAPRRFILMQFLIEAMVLAIVGGIIGIAIGLALGYGISHAIPGMPAATVSWWAVAGSFTFAGLMGTAFGLWPASKAASLAPIDALRYE